MTDSVQIRGLRLQTHIGVGDDERAQPQYVLVSVRLDADLRAASASDSVADTIDYHEVVTKVADLVGSSNVRLLERLAESISQALLADHRVERVTVEIAKESPPIEENLREVSVTIERP